MGGDQECAGQGRAARQELEGALRSGEADDAAAALELGRTGFQETVGSDGRSSLLGSAARPDGSVQFDLAIVGGAETGGGFTAAAAGVLLCARVAATLGRDAQATITDLPCPSGLNSRGGPPSASLWWASMRKQRPAAERRPRRGPSNGWRNDKQNDMSAVDFIGLMRQKVISLRPEAYG